jgi:hypothetical protein
MSKIILRTTDFSLVATQSIATGSYAMGFNLIGDLVKKDQAGNIIVIAGATGISGTSAFGYTSSGIYQIDNAPILSYTYVNSIDFNSRVLFSSTGSTVAVWSAGSNNGIVYTSDLSANFTTYSLIDKNYLDIQLGLVASPIFSINDKNWIALETVTGSIATASNNTVTDSPKDDSYISVYVNGQEFDVGNGVTSSSCFFASGASGPGYPRGFSSTHPNGKTQIGDYLYWNDVAAGVTLTLGWRISLHYLTI